MIDNCLYCDPNYCNSDKGEPNCRCSCCIYWRRHVHRVAANKDRVISNQTKHVIYLKDDLATAKWKRTRLNTELFDAKKTVDMLRKEISKLKKPLFWWLF